MTDYQRIVDDVRNSLYVSGPQAIEVVRSATNAYCRAMDEVNERLRRCNELLKAGLRSEAIHQCELDPNLLDVVATLDFPERDYWVQLLNQHSIAVPGPLLLDVAAELNEAYAIEQPLETLLDRHRLLALAHSPLKLRITTLRKLIEVDGNNPIWREDLLQFERHRHKEIQREASDFASVGDAVAIAKVEKELLSNRWLEAPPTTLIRWVSDARARFSERQIRSQMQQIELELNDAYGEFNEHSGRQLRERWNTLAQSIGLQEHDPLRLRVAPALEWLAQQDAYDFNQLQYAADIEALEEALNMGRPARVLESLHHAVVRHELELPAGLEDRYQTRIAALHAAALKRRHISLFSVVSAIVVIAGVVGVVMIRSARQHAIERNAATLGKFLDEGKLTEAEEFLSKLRSDEPSVVASSEINELSARLTGSTKKESDRQQSFGLAIQVAGQSAKAVADWESLSQAQRLLSEARKIVRTEPEKDDVKRIQLQLAAVDRELQNQENDKVLAKCDTLHLRLVSLEAEVDRPLNGLEIDADKLRSELKSLQQSSLVLNATSRERITKLLEQLDAIEAAFRSQAKLKSEFETISRDVGDPTAFRKSLTEFAAANPASIQSTSFNQAAEEYPLWEDVRKYSELTVSWRKLNHQQIDPSTAMKMVNTARTLLNEAPDFPDAAAFRDRLPFLEAVSRRVNEKGEHAEAPLRSQLAKPWIVDLWLLETQDGLRYYTKEEPEFGNGPSKTVKYVADFDLSEKSKNIRHEDVKEIGVAPQRELAGKALELIHKIDGGKGEPGWERTFVDMVQTIQKADRVDPLLRYVLLQQTLEAGSLGSKCLDTAFAPLRKQLNDTTVNIFANWLDPNDKEARTARSRADTALRSIADLRDISAQAAESWKALAQPVGHEYLWIGWLQRDHAGDWQCKPTANATPSGALIIVRRDGGKHEAVLDNVGTMRDGRAEISHNLGRDAQIEGRPVYLVVPIAIK